MTQQTALDKLPEPELEFIFIRTLKDVMKLKYYYKEKPEHPGAKFMITKTEAFELIKQECDEIDLLDGLEIAANGGFLCDNEHVIYASTK